MKIYASCLCLLPTLNAEKQLGRYLQLIRTATSREQLSKWIDQVSGYMQALSDLELLNAEQAILLRELVTRENFRGRHTFYPGSKKESSDGD